MKLVDLAPRPAKLGLRGRLYFQWLLVCRSDYIDINGTLYAPVRRPVCSEANLTVVYTTYMNESRIAGMVGPLETVKSDISSKSDSDLVCSSDIESLRW